MLITPFFTLWPTIYNSFFRQINIYNKCCKSTIYNINMHKSTHFQPACVYLVSSNICSIKDIQIAFYRITVLHELKVIYFSKGGCLEGQGSGREGCCTAQVINRMAQLV